MKPLLTNSDDFIQNEFRDVDLGDKRLNKRMLEVATIINSCPGYSFPVMSEGHEKQLKGIYRFFQNDKVCEKKILQSHYANTIERMEEYKGKILLLNDSTFVSPAKKMDDLMDRGKGKENCVRVHFTLAVSQDGGQILGVLGFNCLSNKTKREVPEMEKEFNVWSKTLEDSIESIYTFSSRGERILSRCLFIADREADDFELMGFLIKSKLGFIIRSQYNRIVGKHKDKKLFDLISDSKKHGSRYLIKTRKDNTIRECEVERRILREILIPPPTRYGKNHQSLKLNMVLVQEVSDGKDAINWKLWTNEDIKDFDSSEFIVNSYTHRWKIEEINKAAKTGVRVEDRQFTDLNHFVRFLSMAFVVAWRMLALRTIGEIDGKVDIRKAFTEDEADFLNIQAKHVGMKMENVEDATLVIAAIGGFTKKYKKPGWQVLWVGQMRFYDRVLGFQLAKKFWRK